MRLDISCLILKHGSPNTNDNNNNFKGIKQKQENFIDDIMRRQKLQRPTATRKKEAEGDKNNYLIYGTIK